ncbi:MAG: recombinase family protein [Candidatus Binatus sp.]|uniref:recombinase family protein n=1 Tax=Candidatus Binatus sp. TaxID=2811406 RepID=UPI00271F52D7|nr:recombinase family protein [Candidatus Binatus sp.]MDO8430917.1 recombinase family protein [Candidatus Binatus sp.]
MASSPIRRCAIYTRKSSEEGLEQDYNSLHAQREACEAFIRSQAGEGWKLIKTAYDDGGFSGGTIQRPALQQLLASIREGMIDVVVVYKVDRLTRSLADFARMVELFDAHGVSFVAVTQQFNTTTSMGRLTLNVLLSFAQFEREVIGERIRDKVAASKRRGIWMGGSVPIGYDVRERKLLVNGNEAKTVQHIFERYLELGSVRLLKKDLDSRGIVSATRVSRKGNTRGGKPFSRGALYNVLSNPIYLGEIRHRNERHIGQHEAIVSRDLWERVQQQLRSRAVRQGEGRKTEAPRSPLAGKLFDESGEPLYVQGAAKGQRRYRYYVSRRLVRGESQDAEQAWRISAPEIEQTISAAAQEILSDRAAIALALEESGTDPNRLKPVLESAQVWIERLRSDTETATAVSELAERVDLSREGVRLSLRLPLPPPGAGGGAPTDHLSLKKSLPMQVKRRGVEMRMVLEGDSTPGRVDLPLLKAVARARRWSQDLIAGRMQSVGEIAKRDGVAARYVRELMPLGFLAPRTVEAIIEGHQPAELTVIDLTRRIDLPLLWSAHEEALQRVHRLNLDLEQVGSTMH